jgi:hypothetical protein
MTDKKKTHRGKTGVVLTDADIERIADEVAVADYDVALLKRGRGRPALGDGPAEIVRYESTVSWWRRWMPVQRANRARAVRSSAKRCANISRADYCLASWTTGGLLGVQTGR